MNRYFAAGLLGVLVLAGAGLGQASGSPQEPFRLEATPGCKLKGVRFAGTTPQRDPVTSRKGRICLVLSPDGKRLREYEYEYRTSCGGVVEGSLVSAEVAGRRHTTVRPPVALRRDGRFSHSSRGSVLSGRVRGATAAGTFRLRSRESVTRTGDPFKSDLLPCDTGVVRWAARKSGS